MSFVPRPFQWMLVTRGMGPRGLRVLVARLQMLNFGSVEVLLCTIAWRLPSTGQATIVNMLLKTTGVQKFT